MRCERVQALAFRTISQTAIEYRDGPLSREEHGVSRDGPRAGDRFPWLKLQLTPSGPVEDLFERFDDTRWTLLLFGQSAPPVDALPAEAMEVIAVPQVSVNETVLAAARIEQPSYYLLRPDGHVGLCGGLFDAEAMQRYFTDHVQAVS
jgi:hypothetical protein